MNSAGVNLTANQVAEFARRILVVDVSRRWFSSIRTCLSDQPLIIELVEPTDLNQLLNSERCDAILVAATEATLEQAIGIIASHSRWIGAQPFIAILDADNGCAEKILRQAGFAAVFCGFQSVGRIRHAILNLLRWPIRSFGRLEERIEANLPWRKFNDASTE